MWLAAGNDSGRRNIVLTAQKGGYEDGGLVLFKMDAGGKSESLLEISDDFRMVGDGVMDEHNNIYIVYSTLLYNHHANISFVKLVFNRDSGTWSLRKRTIVFPSDFNHYANRATITRDDDGNLWCAFRMYSTADGKWRMKVYVSEDDGDTWQDKFREFGLVNGYSEKNPRIVALKSGVGLVHTDIDNRKFKYYFWTRLDRNSSVIEWTDSEIISRLHSKMEYTGRQYWMSHWSLASYADDNLHLAYEDKSGIYYVLHSGGKWTEPVEIDRRGAYPSVAVSANGAVFIVYKSADVIKIQERNTADDDFSTTILPEVPPGKKRIIVPRDFDRLLPILYETDLSPLPADGPRYELACSLLDTGT